jgi:hypothetical protein
MAPPYSGFLSKFGIDGHRYGWSYAGPTPYGVAFRNGALKAQVTEKVRQIHDNSLNSVGRLDSFNSLSG